jgi:catecholate siderophore receptor
MRIRIKARRKKSLKKLLPQGPRLWVAMGTLAAYSAIGRSHQAFAYVPRAAETGPAVPPDSNRTFPVRRFDIPPGPLSAVLGAYSKATRIVFDVPDPAIGNIASPGVSGLYTDEEALLKILNGTSVRHRFVGPMMARLELTGASTSVSVNATLAPAAISPKYTERLLDTPQSIDIVQQQVIHDQAAVTLRDTLRNFAGISIAAGEGGSQGDNLTIRGFTARNDIFLDGMRDFGSYYRDPFNLEAVEVLQGPSSTTFGRGSTGGVVNQSSKVPGLDQFISGGLQFGTDRTKRFTTDINWPVPKFGTGAAFRLNLMGLHGNVAGRDVAENRRFGIAPSLAFGLGTSTRVVLSYFHQTGDDIPDYGIPWLFNGPAPVNRRNYYGFHDQNYLRTYDDVGTAKVEHDLNSTWTLRNTLRYANYVRRVDISEPQVAAGTTLATPLDRIVVNRRQIAVSSTETALDDQLDVTGRFTTGFLRHALVAGAEGLRETSDPTRPTYANVPTTSLLSPTPYDQFNGIPTITSSVEATAVSGAVYAIDTIRFGQRWQATGGIRWDRFDTDYKQKIAPASAFHRVDQLPTWRAALLYNPAQSGSFYFSAGTSFNPSAETLALTAGNANLPPEKNVSYEGGTKWDLLSRKLSLRGAIFRTEKTNAREPDPNNPALNVLAGEQRVNGFEFQASGRINNRWQLLTGYAYLDGRVVSSNYYPKAVGAQLANLPENTFNFWTTYNVPWHRIDVGGGGQFVDSRTASSTVPNDPVTGLVKQVPSYWVFNAMARYPLTEHVVLQANAYNLANRYYYDQLHPAHIVLGEGRSALIGISFKF